MNHVRNQEHGFSVFLCICVSLINWRHLLFCRPWEDTRSSVENFILTVMFTLYGVSVYKPCGLFGQWLRFQPCAWSEPDCNCCLSNKYTYMQLRSPEVTRVKFHLSISKMVILSW